MKMKKIRIDPAVFGILGTVGFFAFWITAIIRDPMRTLDVSPAVILSVIAIYITWHGVAWYRNQKKVMQHHRVNRVIPNTARDLRTCHYQAQIALNADRQLKIIDHVIQDETIKKAAKAMIRKRAHEAIDDLDSLGSGDEEVRR